MFLPFIKLFNFRPLLIFSLDAYMQSTNQVESLFRQVDQKTGVDSKFFEESLSVAIKERKCACIDSTDMINNWT